MAVTTETLETGVLDGAEQRLLAYLIKGSFVNFPFRLCSSRSCPALGSPLCCQTSGSALRSAPSSKTSVKTSRKSQKSHSLRDVIAHCEALPYLAILGLVVGPGHELQQGQQQPNTQSEAEEEEEAPQVVGLQALRGAVLIVPCASAGPPLVPQVCQLTRLTELEDGHI